MSQVRLCVAKALGLHKLECQAEPVNSFKSARTVW